MFFRRKAVGERTYLQIVESRRDGSSVRQHVVATLGRSEDWLDAGKLDQLLQSGARLSETTLVLSALRDGDGLVVDSRRLGPPLIFERLWRETGCQAVIEGLLAERQFQVPVERAIFASVLHRLCISGSDPATSGWRATGLPGSTASICTTCTGRSPGWVRSWPTRRDAPGRRGRSRTWWRSGCSRDDATCSTISTWCSSIPPPSTSTARVARRSGGAASPRITARN